MSATCLIPFFLNQLLMYKFCSLYKLLLNQSGEQRTCLIDSTLHTLQNFAQEF